MNFGAMITAIMICRISSERLSSVSGAGSRRGVFNTGNSL